jgi:hypothetical protein
MADDYSRFFKNTGAVAGVFSVVGLALAAIGLWLALFVRRRRRTRRLEHDTAVSATLAAAGYGRSPLHDDEDDSDMPSSGRRSSAMMAQVPGSASIFGSRAPSATFAAYTDPFATPHNMHGPVGASDGPPSYGYDMNGAAVGGYMPARTGSPPPLPPGARAPERVHHQHTSSYEPLLGAAGLNGGQRTPSNMSPPGSPPSSPPGLSGSESYFAAQQAAYRGTVSTPPPAIPPRNPMRPSPSTPHSSMTPAAPQATFSRASSVYSQDQPASDHGTLREPDDANAGRLEVRNPGVSRSSSVVNG